MTSANLALPHGGTIKPMTPGPPIKDELKYPSSECTACFPNLRTRLSVSFSTIVELRHNGHRYSELSLIANKYELWLATLHFNDIYYLYNETENASAAAISAITKNICFARDSELERSNKKQNNYLPYLVSQPHIFLHNCGCDTIFFKKMWSHPSSNKCERRLVL